MRRHTPDQKPSSRRIPESLSRRSGCFSASSHNRPSRTAARAGSSSRSATVRQSSATSAASMSAGRGGRSTPTSRIRPSSRCSTGAVCRSSRASARRRAASSAGVSRACLRNGVLIRGGPARCQWRGAHARRPGAGSTTPGRAGGRAADSFLFLMLNSIKLNNSSLSPEPCHGPVQRSFRRRRRNDAGCDPALPRNPRNDGVLLTLLPAYAQLWQLLCTVLDTKTCALHCRNH